MKTELENIEFINGLLKEAKENFDRGHLIFFEAGMREINTCIKFLSFNTGKNYVIKGTELIVKE